MVMTVLVVDKSSTQWQITFIDKERFRNIDVAEAEKQRQSSDRERRQDRYDFRRLTSIYVSQEKPQLTEF